MQKGFTLIELMIAMVIISILAAIAIPYYHDYVIRTKRGDMQTELVRISQEIQRYKAANRFINAAQANRLFSSTYPASGTALYNVRLNTVGQTKTVDDGSLDSAKIKILEWQLVATPIAGQSQKDDGVLILNSQGLKCRGAKSANSCTPKATSSSDWR